MYITNSTSATFILYGGYILRPESQVTIPDNIYSGNSTLKNQVDNMLEHGMINAYDKPEDPVAEIENLPENYEAGSQELAITKNSGVAALSVDTDVDEIDFGSVELVATGGSASSLKSYSDDIDVGMLDINKNSNEDGSLLLLKLDNVAILQIGSTGADATYAFDGKDPIVSPTLDPESITAAADVINALISLGLARGA